MSLTRELIQDGIAEPKNQQAMVKAFVLSHGTMEVYNLRDSRKFYEEISGPGMRAPRQAGNGGPAGLKFHIVAVEVGAAVHPVNVLNHWAWTSIPMKRSTTPTRRRSSSRTNTRSPGAQAGDAARRVLVLHGGPRPQLVGDPALPGFQNQDLFDFGDRFSMEDGAEVGELKELNIKTTA